MITRAIRTLTLVASVAALGCSHAPNLNAHDGTQVPSGKADSPAAVPWGSSYQPPTVDRAGEPMHATEVIALKEYGGRLWAATGNWSYDISAGPQPPPQIVVLDDSSGRWQVAQTFDAPDGNGHYRFLRVTGLHVVPDEAGANPKLVATLDALNGQGGIFVFDPATSRWVDSQFSSAVSVRSLARFDDPLTGRALLFAGGGKSLSADHLTAAAIYRARLDASHPETGGVVWEQEEASGLQDRVMAFASAFGRLYATDKSNLFVRRHRADGSPFWQDIYTYPGYGPRLLADGHVSGLRALTAFKEGGETFLLTGAEYTSDILHITLDAQDPARVAVSTELNVRAALSGIWVSVANADVTPTYSEIPQLSDPVSGATVGLFGLLAMKPADETATWFLRRDPGGSYALHRIAPDPSTRGSSSDPRLRGLRTLATHNGDLYAGGFDGSFLPDVDTAWIYRRPIDAAFAAGVVLK
jgi:hypothetical protein